MINFEFFIFKIYNFDKINIFIGIKNYLFSGMKYKLSSLINSKN